MAAVGERRTNALNLVEYETTWSEGSVTWEQARSFMDADGTFNFIWLEKAKESDVQAALLDLTVDQLQELCDHQHWKVRSVQKVFR